MSLTNLFVAVWVLQINGTQSHNAALLLEQINTSSDRRCRSPLLSFSFSTSLSTTFSTDATATHLEQQRVQWPDIFTLCGE